MATNIQRFTSYVSALTNNPSPTVALMEKIARSLIRDDVAYNAMTFDQKAAAALVVSRQWHISRMRTWDAHLAEVSTAGQADTDLAEIP